MISIVYLYENSWNEYCADIAEMYYATQKEFHMDNESFYQWDETINHFDPTMIDEFVKDTNFIKNIVATFEYPINEELAQYEALVEFLREVEFYDELYPYNSN